MIMKVSNLFKYHKLSVLLALLIYISNDTLLFGTNSNRFFINMQFVFLLIVSLFLLVVSIKRKKLNSKLFLILVFLTLLSTFTMIFKDDISFKYFYELLLIFVVMLVTSLWTKERVLDELTNVLHFYTFFSLIPFLINIIYQPLLDYFPTFVNIAGYKYHNLIFGFVPYNTYLFNIYRNISFFRESGVFGCFLNLNLFILLFERKSKNIVRILLNIIVTITTLSTGAIICMMFLLFIYFIYQKIGIKKMMYFIIFCLSFTLISSSAYLNTAIFGKLQSDNASLYSRVSSIYSNINITLYNPILGDGWSKIEDDFEYISSQKFGSSILHGEKNYHNTNTLLKISAVHGLLFFVIYIMGFYKFVMLNNNKTLLSISLFLCLLLMFSYEDLTLNFIIPLIAFYGLKGKKKEKKYESC